MCLCGGYGCSNCDPDFYIWEDRAEQDEPALHINQQAQGETCPTCGGTGQDDPPLGKYHGLCSHCGGSGKLSPMR